MVEPLAAQAETGEATLPNLISAPALIFDEEAITVALTAAFDGVSDASELRQAAVSILRKAQTEGRAEIARAFAAAPFDAREMTSAYCYLTDQLVRSALQISTQRLYPKPNPTGTPINESINVSKTIMKKTWTLFMPIAINIPNSLPRSSTAISIELMMPKIKANMKITVIIITVI